MALNLSGRLTVNGNVILSTAEAAWTPAEISTSLWLDAADANTVSDTAGIVSQWDDKSINSYTFSGATNQPNIATATLNGLPVMYFDGTSKLVADQAGSTFDWMRGATPYFMAMVVRAGSTSNPNALMSIMSSGGATRTIAGFDLAYDDRSGIYEEAIRSIISSGTDDFGVVADIIGTTGWMSPNTNTLLELEINATASPADNRIDWRNAGGPVFNFTNIKSGGLSGTTANPLTLGELGNGTGFNLEGTIAEVVALPTVATDPEREQIEGYLAWKWGLVADLPAAHPYKSAPPLV